MYYHYKCPVCGHSLTEQRVLVAQTPCTKCGKIMLVTITKRIVRERSVFTPWSMVYIMVAAVAAWTGIKLFIEPRQGNDQPVTTQTKPAK